MATVVDINNIALSMLGDRATLTSIDPPEGSAQADHCARFYPIARDEALEAFDWTFARRIELATATTSPHPGWMYAYYVPNNCLRVRGLTRDTGIAMVDPQDDIHYELMTDSIGREIVVANEEDLYVVFTAVISDPAKFSSGFCAALEHLLASKLAGPVLKGRTGAQASKEMYAAYQMLISKEATRNLNQSSLRLSHIPAAMRARGSNVTTSRRIISG